LLDENKESRVFFLQQKYLDNAVGESHMGVSTSTRRTCPERVIGVGVLHTSSKNSIMVFGAMVLSLFGQTTE
jgi:hypothetical protein